MPMTVEKIQPSQAERTTIAISAPNLDQSAACRCCGSNWSAATRSIPFSTMSIFGVSLLSVARTTANAPEPALTGDIWQWYPNVVELAALLGAPAVCSTRAQDSL